MATFFYNQYMLRFSDALFNYVTFTLVFANSPIYQLGQFLYKHFFNLLFRVRGASSRNSTKLKALNDWENPEIVGKNRCKAHVKLFSFKNKDLALKYWLKENSRNLAVRNEIIKSNIVNLTTPEIPWDLAMIGSPEAVPLSWYLNPNEISKDITWYKIHLPGHWQLQTFSHSNNDNSDSSTAAVRECRRFDTPIYTNTTYPFACDPPFARRNGSWYTTFCDIGLGAPDVHSGPLHRNEPGENATALYKCSFKVPEDWQHGKSERVFIVFEGVDACISVWLNGSFIGYSQDSCLPAEFEITQFLVSANTDSYPDNTLCLQVSRWCDGSYLEAQDKWWLSGVYREVYIMRKPTVFIADYEVNTNVSKEISSVTAIVSVEILIDGFQSSSDLSTLSVECELWRDDGNTNSPLISSTAAVWTIADRLSSEDKAFKNFTNLGYTDVLTSADKHSVAPTSSSTPSNRKAVSKASLRLNNPNMWTAEDPNLYILTICLKMKNKHDGEESVVDVESRRVGIRTVKIEGESNQLCVNGSPILIAGVNRHEVITIIMNESALLMIEILIAF